MARPLLLIFMLVCVACALGACQRRPPVPPVPAAMPRLELSRVEDREPVAPTVHDRRTVTVLVLHLVEEGPGEGLQRQYWTKLANVLRGRGESRWERLVLRVVHAERGQALIDGGPAAIVAVGEALGADLVVWGSVHCTSSEACVRPNVTYVDREQFGDEVEAWRPRAVSKASLMGSNDVGGVDQSVEGLVSELQDDLPRAERLMRQALEDAEELQLPEAEEYRGFMREMGFRVED